jgi:mono/diheme cytochrome c family protein
MRRRPRTLVGASLLTVAVLALSACGGGGEEAGSTTGPVTTLALTTPSGDPVAGREVFLSAGCGACHTLQDAGTTGVTGPDLDTDLVGSAEASGAPLAEHVRTAIVDPDAWVMPRWANGVMPRDFGDKLSDEELDDLVAYVVQAVQ